MVYTTIRKGSVRLSEPARSPWILQQPARKNENLRNRGWITGWFAIRKLSFGLSQFLIDLVAGGGEIELLISSFACGFERLHIDG